VKQRNTKYFKQVNLKTSFGACGCEILSVALKEKHKLLVYKDKGKISRVHTMKECRGSRGNAPGTRWR
jgi:translation initiation factor IF-2